MKKVVSARYNSSLLFVGLLLMAGCATQPPAPVIHRGETGVISSVPAAVSSESSTSVPTSASATSAATALIGTASQLIAEKDYTQALSVLERAQRISPRDPQVWSSMAEVRLALEEYSQAESFALKSNSLSRNQVVILKRNWAIIQKARKAMGDPAGAAEAGRLLEQLKVQE